MGQPLMLSYRRYMTTSEQPKQRRLSYARLCMPAGSPARMSMTLHIGGHWRRSFRYAGERNALAAFLYLQLSCCLQKLFCSFQLLTCFQRFVALQPSSRFSLGIYHQQLFLCFQADGRTQVVVCFQLFLACNVCFASSHSQRILGLWCIHE